MTFLRRDEMAVRGGATQAARVAAPSGIGVNSSCFRR
jgi:hypothetical protein